MCNGLPMIECRRLAYEMAMRNNISVPENWKTKQMAGEKWMRLFMKRHYTLSLRTPEGCSLARATAFNKFNVGTFFDKLEECYTRNPKFVDGTRLFNHDETAAMTNQKLHAKVVAERGSQQVSKKYYDSAVETHKLQPLDVGIFGPFQKYYDSAVDSWMMHHPEERFSIYEVAECVGKAHEKALVPETITKAFKVTGIRPFNRHIFKESDFLCSSVTDQPPGEDTVPVNEGKPSDHLSQESDFLCSSVTDQPPGEDTVPVNEGKPSDHLSQPEISANLNEAPTQSNVPGTPPSVCNKQQLELSTSTVISPVEFRGYPKSKPRKGNRKPRRKGKCMIATDTPEKNEIQEYQERRSRLQTKGVAVIRKIGAETNKRPIKKKKTVLDDTSDSESLPNLSSDTEISEEDFENTLSQNFEELQSDSVKEISEEDFENTLSQNFEELQSDSVKEDYVLVQFKARGTNVFYVGRVINNVNENNEIEVSFLRKSSKLQGNFVTPNIADISFVSINDVKIILPKPTYFGQTKRQNSYLSFEINFGDLDVR
ncbi:hypothetical protein QE152_g24451 [Popillia japonica]|uniref:HTH CENPB-type domain-containing protein n=1 Tax=Popillia japonica TaxID=7064 RepID=A0AAW1KB45_POPJA